MKNKSLVQCIVAGLGLLAIPAFANPPGFNCSITSPNNNAVIQASCGSGKATITIDAEATLTSQNGSPPNSVTSVDFYQGTTLLGTDYTYPYSFTWNNVVVGSYTLNIAAHDSLGRTAQGGGVAITVSSPATTVSANQSGYTFESGETYYVPNTITISGTTVIEAGAVIKFAPGACLTVDTVDCQTTALNPAILTARDDDSVGCVLPESTHSVSSYYAGTSGEFAQGALLMTHAGDTSLQHLRINYAWTAVSYDAGGDFGSTHSLEDVIINYSGFAGLYTMSAMVDLQDVEIHHGDYALQGFYWGGTADSIAVSDCFSLAEDDGQNGESLYITDSTVSNVMWDDGNNGNVIVDGDNNGFHSAATFGSNPYTF
jgi:hypothetical protein